MMTAKPQVPVGQTYHQVLADHLTNLPILHVRAVQDAIAEHVRALERVKLLETENAALLSDVARLTRKLHEREDVVASKRVNGKRV